ncbi:MAG TPA: HAD family phosphatase [Gemmatimonadales bacterium]|nr:HAD family phosphatase [Gemmatimonadales bacterium]
MTPDHGVCFDFNGVIVDDERHHASALIATLADAGITLDEATYYRDYLGYDDRGCFRHAYDAADRPLDDATLATLIDTKGERYRDGISRDLTMVPGVTTFIRALADVGTRLVIVSAARRWEIEHVLGEAGLRDCFRAIVAAEDVERTKPDPEGYRKGLAHLALGAERVVVVEDSLPGFRAGRAAGMRVAMVATSHPIEELAEAAPDALWPSFEGRRPEELPWIRT